ncbi:Replication factor C subunit 4 [Paramicrosporidium saccamoebae]|uniref:Replication factor C subunit 4 n=1 Tax=Paramicrosporidium saccamoebae TaxID=1246581 RepID=A0A2H9TKC3_9FUNG|nr:Replication factor C subunit 4 [Paramicrosporidium saccamoebae]
MLASSELELPWVEKYRPRFLNNVVGNEEIVQRLQVIAQTGNMPHMLLAGPPGIGKTTSIMCLATELLGPAVKDAVLELNASDERGIEVVRNQIKSFASKKVVLPPGRHKLIILDEADSMTSGAQQALRRIMEVHSSTTRFALACNNSSKIIEPIQSRCAILRYGRLGNEQLLKRVVEVCELEGVGYSPEGLEAIMFTADGDMRQALNNLQSTHAGFGYVNADNVYRVCDSPHPAVIQEIVMACVGGSLDRAQAGLDQLWSLGYSAVDIVSTFFRVVKFLPKDRITEPMQLDFIREIGLIHMRILEGVSTKLQLTGLLANMCLVASGKTLQVVL